jgi:hypothetical protein
VAAVHVRGALQRGVRKRGPGGGGQGGGLKGLQDKSTCRQFC